MANQGEDRPAWLLALDAQRSQFADQGEDKPAWLLALDTQRNRHLPEGKRRNPRLPVPRTLMDLYNYARELTPLALATLQEVMEHGRSENARVLAANSLLDRAWGKPVTPIEHGGTVTITEGAREKLATLLAKMVESKIEETDKPEMIGELIGSDSEPVLPAADSEPVNSPLGPPSPGIDDP